MAQRLPSMSEEKRMISVIQEESRAFAYLLNQRKTIRELIGRPDAFLASMKASTHYTWQLRDMMLQ